MASDPEETEATTYRCDIHDFGTDSRGLMHQHIDLEHPGGAAKRHVDEFLVTIHCDRCASLATKSFEGSGDDCFDLCDRCYRDLGRWLNRE